MNVFVFRRDLRADDNVGFCEFCKLHGNDVVPVFVFNPAQISPQRNPYYCNNTMQFMIESLLELSDKIPLLFFQGSDADVLQQLKPKSVGFNCDITPFARRRDQSLVAWCDARGVACHMYSDYTLLDPAGMPKPYQKFTPFYKKYVDTNTVPIPRAFAGSMATVVCARALPRTKLVSYFKPNPHLAVRGGRKNALAIIDRIGQGQFAGYGASRDTLTSDSTMLSAYLKYGCVSIREVYHAVVRAHGKSHALVRELYWRAFYDQLIWWFPDLLRGQVTGAPNQSLRPRYDAIKWDNDESLFAAWCEGRTGFPMVDAAMRQLNATGFMHNRCRMVVASFLIKDLGVDWRWGERYFASKLVDVYHPSNVGGWGWASGAGADAQQYNRVFNPWLQSAKFDPNCAYIKRHVPELGPVPPRHVHEWYKHHAEHGEVAYPRPVVDPKERVARVQSLYKQALAS
jgi:deoxyribodipyrimidine photo-lyase